MHAGGLHTSWQEQHCSSSSSSESFVFFRHGLSFSLTSLRAATSSLGSWVISFSSSSISFLRCSALSSASSSTWKNFDIGDIGSPLQLNTHYKSWWVSQIETNYLEIHVRDKKFEKLGQRILGQGYSQADKFWCVLNVSLSAYGAQRRLDWTELYDGKRDMVQGGGQLTSFDPKNVKSDLYDGKKRHVTDTGPQLTSLMEKTSRHWRWTSTHCPRKW